MSRIYNVFYKIICDCYISLLDRFLMCCFLVEHIPYTICKKLGCVDCIDDPDNPDDTLLFIPLRDSTKETV